MPPTTQTNAKKDHDTINRPLPAYLEAALSVSRTGKLGNAFGIKLAQEDEALLVEAFGPADFLSRNARIRLTLRVGATVLAHHRDALAAL